MPFRIILPLPKVMFDLRKEVEKLFLAENSPVPGKFAAPGVAKEYPMSSIF